MTSLLRFAGPFLVVSFVAMAGCSLVVAPDERRLGLPDDARVSNFEGGSVDAAADTVIIRDVPIAPGPDVVLTCAAGTANCSGQCVDLTSSAQNCGRCGLGCNGGENCVTGRCTPINSCVAPRMLCGTNCLDTSADSNHCGSCTRACSSGEICMAGSCVTRCSAPYAACGTAGCVDTRSDPRNCGGCGMRCPDPAVCAAGVCACPPGETRCAGICVDMTTDVNNCGSCGNGCGGGSCVSGVCTAGDPCASNTGCRSCTGVSTCGWCRNVGSCHSGSATGPGDGACSGTSWSWLSSQCH